MHRLSLLMIGTKVLYFKELESTNLTAAELLKNKEVKEGAVIVSTYQNQGKGQEGNDWESEAGKNLLISVVLKPGFLKPEKQFALNKIVSLAVVEFVGKLLPNEVVKIKWPNDIYIGDKKVAGILITNSITGNTFDSSVVGIGINLNQKFFLSNAPNPVSVYQISRKQYDLEESLDLLLEIFNRWYKLLENGLFNSIDKNYLTSLYRFEEYHAFKIGAKEIEAKITDISKYGRLLLKGKNLKTYECDLKEVEFVI